MRVVVVRVRVPVLGGWARVVKTVSMTTAGGEEVDTEFSASETESAVGEDVETGEDVNTDCAASAVKSLIFGTVGSATHVLPPNKNRVHAAELVQQMLSAPETVQRMREAGQAEVMVLRHPPATCAETKFA